MPREDGDLDRKDVTPEAVFAALAKAKAQVQYIVNLRQIKDAPSMWHTLLYELEKLEQTIPAMRDLCKQDDFVRMHLIDQSYKHFRDVITAARRMAKATQLSRSEKLAAKLTGKSKSIRFDKEMHAVRDQLLKAQGEMNFDLAIGQLKVFQDRVSEMSGTALYAPLSQINYEIRVLELVDIGSHDGGLTAELDEVRLEEVHIRAKPPITYRLVTQSLVRSHDFYALSYCWGHYLAASTLTANGKSVNTFLVNGKSMDCTPNLAAALREVYRRGIRRIWVDAVCINQSDAVEKSSQILLMGQIYRQATGVISWLGDTVRPAVQALSAATQATTYPPDLMRHEDQTGHLGDVKSIMEYEYFSRKWILQEIAKATHVELWAGEHTLQFQEIARYTTYGKCLPSCEYGCHQHFEPRYWDTLSSLCTFRQQEQEQSLRENRMRLSTALIASRYCSASDERDYIYALIGLTRDGPEIVPMPNYMQSVVEVFTDTTRYMVARQGLSSVITLAGISRRREFHKLSKQEENRLRDARLPTWVPDWSDLPEDLPGWVLYNIHASESLGHGGEPVDSSGALSDSCSHDTKVIRVRGQVLDRIGEGTKEPPPDVLYDAARGTYNVHLRDSAPVSTIRNTLRILWDIFMLVLQDSEGGIPDIATEHSCDRETAIAHSLAFHTSEPNKYTWVGHKVMSHLGIVRLGELTLLECSQRLLAELSPCEDEETSQGTEYALEMLERAWKAIDKYEMKIVVTQGGHLCMANRHAQRGDLICVLDGCALPLLLRKAGEHRYQYVGEICSSTLEASSERAADAARLFCLA